MEWDLGALEEVLDRNCGEWGGEQISFVSATLLELFKELCVRKNCMGSVLLVDNCHLARKAKVLLLHSFGSRT